MLAVLDGRAVITILPECSSSLFSPIEFLGYAAGDEIHRGWDGTLTKAIQDKKVDVVRCQGIVKNYKSVSFLGLEKPMEPAPSVLCELQEECLFMAAVGYVPNLARDEVAVGPRHRLKLRFLFERRFVGPKLSFKKNRKV